MVDYVKKVNDVVNYITENIFDELSLEKISQVAELSKFHFHKIFKSVMGETAADFIKRLRIEKSAQMLILEDKPVTDIAVLAGFSSPSVMAREFKNYYDLTPREFRKFFKYCSFGNGECTKETVNGECSLLCEEIKTKGNRNLKDIIIKFEEDIEELPLKSEVRKIPDYRVIYMRYIGDYEDDIEIKKIWDLLISFYMSSDFINDEQNAIGIIYDYPEVCSPGKFRYDACLSITDEKNEVGLPETIGIKRVTGGLYAVFDFKGTMQEIKGAYLWIFRTWFAGCDYVLDEREIYLKYDKWCDLEGCCEFKICVPVRRGK